MNAWKTMLVYTLLAMVAAPMFAPATNKAPQMVFRFVEENNMFKVKTAENAIQDELTLTDLQKQTETAAASQEKTSKPIHSRRVGKPMTTAPAFTRDGNCVTADARNNTPAGPATITDWQVQEVVNITIK